MNYNSLFNRFLKLLVSPAKAWKEISGDKESLDVLSGYVYPLIGVCGFVTFIAEVIRYYGDKQPYEMFRMVITDCCVMCVALFGGFFLSAYVVHWAGNSLYGLKNRLSDVYAFVGYSMSVVFFTYILFPLFADSRVLLYLLQIYTLSVVWEGVPVMTDIDDSRKGGYTLIVTAAILCSNIAIYMLFNILM